MFISYKRIVLTIGFFMGVMISGCGQQNDEMQPLPSQNQSQETCSRETNCLRLALSGPIENIEPGLMYLMRQLEIINQLFLGLTSVIPTSLDEEVISKYKIVPKLATNWQVTKNGTVYTFVLRKNVRWTHGEPVTAHDIVWTIRHNLKRKEVPFREQLYILKNAKKLAQRIDDKKDVDLSSLGVRALDDYTIEFMLEHAVSYFPVLVSFVIYRPLPRKIVEKYNKNWTKPANIQTNGPYKLVKWREGSQIFLERNPTYYDVEQVKIQNVHYYIVPENSIGLKMYENNELDILGGYVYLSLPQTDILRIKSDPDLAQDLKSGYQACTEWYGFNVQRFPTNDLQVRKAIAAVIDKKMLIDIVLKGSHSPATSFIPPYTPPINSVDESKEVVDIQFNPNHAKKWLTEAGYPNGQGFPKLVLMSNIHETDSEVAKGIKTLLKHYLNIDIEIRELDYQGYRAALRQYNQEEFPHLFRATWCGDYPDAHNFLYGLFHPERGWYKKGWNRFGWSNRQFTYYIEQAQQISDETERKILYHKAEKILIEEEVAIIPLYFYRGLFLVKPWVKEWYNMAFGGQHIDQWSLSK